MWTPLLYFYYSASRRYGVDFQDGERPNLWRATHSATKLRSNADCRLSVRPATGVRNYLPP
jgi:hypothetical protein